MQVFCPHIVTNLLCFLYKKPAFIFYQSYFNGSHGNIAMPCPYDILYSKSWRLLWATYQTADATIATQDLTTDVDVTTDVVTMETACGGLLSFYSSAADAATMVVLVQTTTVDVMTTITIAVVPSSGSSYYPAFAETAAFSNSYLFR